MSISRKIVEHALSDNGEKARSSIYTSINEKVADLLEMKKIELAGGSLVSEEDSYLDDLVYKMEKTASKINTLEEEIAILEEYLEVILSEESSCDSDDDMDSDDVEDAIEKKKKKLKKAKKKMKKMQEELSLFEDGEVDEEGEWSEENEEDSDESDDETN